MMITKEEIREGLEARCIDPCNYGQGGCDGYARTEGIGVDVSPVRDCRRCMGDLLLAYLDSQGVVLKVERELPKLPLEHTNGGTVQQDMLKAGYVPVERLISEEESCPESMKST